MRQRWFEQAEKLCIFEPVLFLKVFRRARAFDHLAPFDSCRPPTQGNFFRSTGVQWRVELLGSVSPIVNPGSLSESRNLSKPQRNASTERVEKKDPEQR